MSSLRKGSCLRRFEGHKHSVTCFEIFFDDPAEDEKRNYLTTDTCNDSRDYLVTGSSDWTARLWAVKSGVYLKTFSGHNGGILCLTIDISCRALFTGSSDQTVKKWDVITGEYNQTMKGHTASITQITAKNRVLCSTSADWSVRLWSSQFGDFIKKFEGGHEHMVGCLKWFDGLIVTGSGDGTLKVFDPCSPHSKATLNGHKYAINCIAVHPGGHIVSGSYDSSVRIWNVKPIADKLKKTAENMPDAHEDEIYTPRDDEAIIADPVQNSRSLTPTSNYTSDDPDETYLHVQSEKDQIRRRSQVDDMLMSSIAQIVEYNLVDDITDTVMKQIRVPAKKRSKLSGLPEVSE